MDSLASRHGSTITFTLVIITQQYNMEGSNRKYIIKPTPIPNSNLLNEFITNLALVPYYATVPTWCKIRRGMKLVKNQSLYKFSSPILDKIWLSFPIFNSPIAGSKKDFKVEHIDGGILMQLFTTFWWKHSFAKTTSVFHQKKGRPFRDSKIQNDKRSFLFPFDVNQPEQKNLNSSRYIEMDKENKKTISLYK